MTFDKKKLVETIGVLGVQWAPKGEEFTLASGAKSEFYVDFSRIVMHPQGIAVVSDAVERFLPVEYFDAIGGPMSGADPIIGSVLCGLNLFTQASKRNIRGFTIRKEPKGRGPGAGDMYEGYLEKDDKVVIIEDVTTSGGSVLKAIKVVEERGASVVRVITLLDRQAGAAEKLKDYNFVAITTLEDIKPWLFRPVGS